MIKLAVDSMDEPQGVSSCDSEADVLEAMGKSLGWGFGLLDDSYQRNYSGSS